MQPMLVKTPAPVG